MEFSQIWILHSSAGYMQTNKENLITLAAVREEFCVNLDAIPGDGPWQGAQQAFGHMS